MSNGPNFFFYSTPTKDGNQDSNARSNDHVYRLETKMFELPKSLIVCILFIKNEKK
jgi:hypothetical protein